MRLKGISCIYFEYEVYLLTYTIKVKHLKILNWAFEVFRFKKNKKPRFLKPSPTALLAICNSWVLQQLNTFV